MSKECKFKIGDKVCIHHESLNDDIYDSIECGGEETSVEIPDYMEDLLKRTSMTVKCTDKKPHKCNDNTTRWTNMVWLEELPDHVFYENQLIKTDEY